MLKILKILGCLFALIHISTLSMLGQQLKVDTIRSSLEFNVMHMGVLEVRGEFHKFHGTAFLANKETLDSILMSIEVVSIDTDNKMRDSALKGKDIFDAMTYPEILFEGRLSQNQLIGFLKVKNHYEPILISIGESNWSNHGVYISFIHKINRNTYQLNFGAMNDLIEEEVEVAVNIYLVLDQID